MAMPKPEKPEKSPMGLFCPYCHGARLAVVSVSRPCPGLKVRYRKCSACGCRLTTREVVVRSKKMTPLAKKT